MAIVQPLEFEVDFARNPISELAAWFFFIILKFIFTAIFETKNHVKIIIKKHSCNYEISMNFELYKLEWKFLIL